MQGLNTVLLDADGSGQIGATIFALMNMVMIVVSD
jgi:hypothetical protein